MKAMLARVNEKVAVRVGMMVEEELVVGSLEEECWEDEMWDGDDYDFTDGPDYGRWMGDRYTIGPEPVQFRFLRPVIQAA